MIRLTRMLLFLLLFLLARPVASQAQPNVDAVLNGASYDGAVSPGCWIAIFGSDLATAEAAAESVPLPKSLGGVTVTIGGIEAPLSFVGPGQINALIPFEVEIPESGVVPVTVTTSEGPSNPYTIFINRVSPALFTINAQGTGRTFVLSPNFQMIDPVAEDDVVILYATGLGQTDPPAKSDEGGSSTEPFNRVTEEMKVYIGDLEADVLFAGLAPGFPGVFQLNVRVPKPATDRVFLRSGGWQSNIVEAGIQEGQNATIMEAKIQGVYPPTDPLDGQILPPEEPLSLPLVPHVGRFEVGLEILPDAEPFFVAAVGDVGSAVILIDPVQGTYEATVTLPTEKSRMWDFSDTEFTSLREYLSCRPEGCDLFPDNMIPLVRVEPNSFTAVQLLSLLPNTEIPRSSVGLLKMSGVLENDSLVAGEFTDNSSLSQFGGFLQFPFGPLAERSATFKLYVDGKLVVSSDTTYEVVNSQGISGSPDAVPIFDSIGPIDGSGGGVCLGCGEDLVHANAFSVPQGNDYRLASIEVQVDVNIFSSPPPVQFRLRLMSDAYGEPGEIIGEFMSTATNSFPDPPEILSLDSVLKPVLTAGTRYWLAGTAEPSAGVTWYPGSTDGTIAQSVNGMPWALLPDTQLNGFRIIGQPIP